MGWREFEKQCFNYLTETYGNHFELKGSSDSTVSDILDMEGNFFYEAKHIPSQCGQFVVNDNNKFEFSDKNKTVKNRYTQTIIQYMNDNYENVKNPGTKGIELNIPQEICFGWVKDYYLNVKKAKYFITNKERDFLIVPIEDLDKYFELTCKYRVKRSGTRKLNKAHTADLEKVLIDNNIEFEMNGLDIVSNEDLSDKRFTGEKCTYLLRKDGSSYKVRIISNTNNANVIFSIKFKKSI